MPAINFKTTLTTLLIGVAAAGCGGPSDQEQVRNLIGDYLTAFSKNDGAKVCSLLTANAQRDVQKGAGLIRGKDCAETMTTLSKISSEAAPGLLKLFHAGKVVVDGNEAGVIIQPAAPGTKPTKLVKVDGKWLIDGSVSISRK